MGEQERSPKEQDQHSQEFLQRTDRNGFSKNPRGELYLPESYLAERKKKSAWLLSIREKTAWDWLSLLVVPVLIATIAGTFTLVTVSKQNEISKQQNETSKQLNEIFKQRDEAEKKRNQQALLIEYLNEISELVEKQLLTLNDDEKSETQRTIARARTLSVLRALDSDRKGELIQFLSAARLIERDKPIIALKAYLRDVDLRGADLSQTDLSQTDLWFTDLSQANLRGADLREAYLNQANLGFADLRKANLEGANPVFADFRGANLKGANLKGVNLEGANLRGAYLREVNLEGANLRGAYLWRANLGEANLGEANLREVKNLNPTQIKSACNWEKAEFSKKFQQKLAQEPDQKLDCSRWD